MNISLPPIYHRDFYAYMVEKEVMGHFKEVLFDPLFAELQMARVNEAPEKEHPVVWDALLAGTLWYASGVFTGFLNAAVSRELRAMGAVRVASGFALKAENVPLALRGAISLVQARSGTLHRSILALLDSMEKIVPEAPVDLTLSKTVDSITEDLQKQLVQSFSAAKELSPPSPVPPGTTEVLRGQLATGTERAIKNFSVEAIQQLRRHVAQNLSDGGRTDRLAKIIETEFGVTQRKARIIAEAETSNLVSTFRQERYESLGCTEYIWSTSHDERVRPTHGESNNHRILDGRRFSWASPPVVDSATGRRCHPGQDYGPCRCTVRPLVPITA